MPVNGSNTNKGGDFYENNRIYSILGRNEAVCEPVREGDTFRTLGQCLRADC